VKQITLGLAAGLLLSGTLSSQTSAGVRPNRPQLSVCLYNLVHVPDQILRIGEDQTSELLSRVGIDVEWRDVTLPQADSAQECQGIHLIIAQAPSVSGNSPLAKGATQEGVGWAFYDRVESLAGACSRFLSIREFPDLVKGRVLGVIMTHEIGHVLKLPHSCCGIMRANLAAADFSSMAGPRLHFTSQDAQQLATRLATARQDK
jgi:hypothetical protein